MKLALDITVAMTVVVTPRSGSGGSPVASDVAITGTPIVGQTLTASYNYSNPNGNAQGTSTFRWFRDGIVIVGATASTYLLAVADIGAVITVEVTPKAIMAPVQGVPVLSAGTTAVGGIEQDYLQFTAASLDYGYVPGGAVGVQDTLGWALVCKSNGRITSGAYCSVYDDSAGNTRFIDLVYGGTTPLTVQASGWNASGALGYDVGNADVTTGKQVVAVAHRNVATRRIDRLVTQAGATLINSGANLGSGGDTRTPLHLSVGAYVSSAGGPHVGSSFGSIPLVALVLVRDNVTAAELQAYSLADDARTVWDASRLWGYWPASGISGASIPNLGSGTVIPMTLVGPVAGDLVAL